MSESDTPIEKSPGKTIASGLPPETWSSSSLVSARIFKCCVIVAPRGCWVAISHMTLARAIWLLQGAAVCDLRHRIRGVRLTSRARLTVGRIAQRPGKRAFFGLPLGQVRPGVKMHVRPLAPHLSGCPASATPSQEQPFWEAFHEIATERGSTMTALLNSIASEKAGNLSSACACSCSNTFAPPARKETKA